MDEMPRSRMTLRQALSRQWQIPLFMLSGVAFVFILVQMRPQGPKRVSFDERLESLRSLSQENRYDEFYQRAELLRLEAEDEGQLGRVHALAAQTRVKQLKQSNEFDIDLSQRRGARENYQKIIQDYSEALQRKQPDPESSASSEIYHDISLAYWSMNEAGEAIRVLLKAIEVADEFVPLFHRNLVQMYFASRPENYLSLSLENLEKLMTQPESSGDDRAWAFLRKTEVLLGQGNEEEALALLERADHSIKESQYGEELEYLRGRALHQVGQTDQADEVLRALLKRITDSGDTYAQTALELGKINYEQYRDQDARRFYQLVVDSQLGKDWYLAGKLGLAESALMQQRYNEALQHYQGTVDLLNKAPHNRAVTFKQVQQSLAVWGQNFGLLKQYETALPLLEIEQQIADEDDVNAAFRFAQVNARRALQLQEQLKESEQAVKSGIASAEEEQWLQQQQQQISAYFETAAEQYLRVAYLAGGDDDLYKDNLWQSASSYNKAGNVEKTIETWHRFVTEQEGESRWPRALFNLAQACQANGDFGQAIDFYETLLSKHPQSLATFDGIVPLAHSYLALEPPERDKAETLLRSVLQDPAINPPSSYFRDALFELGELYYDSQNYPEAISKLTEAINRYPNDEQLGKFMFLVGDSYRKSGQDLDEQLAELDQDPTATVRRQKTFSQLQKYLESARDYFNRAIEFYSQTPESRRSSLAEMYMRHCWLYRADCMFDLGRYQEAIDLYELAVLRYQLTPTALASFVQIVNCHLRLDQPREARSANQRAIWQLRNMPDEVLAEGPTKLTRQQWQDWFEGIEKSNLW
ncbi:tetratricopeptide repeat protein [Planctomycetota bacterium]